MKPVLEELIIKYKTRDTSIDDITANFRNISSDDLVEAIKKLNQRFLFPSFKALLIELICTIYEHILNDVDGCTFDENYKDYNQFNRILKSKLESINEYENLLADLKLFKKFYLFYCTSAYAGFCESGVNYSSIKSNKLMTEYDIFFKSPTEQPNKFFKYGEVI